MIQLRHGVFLPPFHPMDENPPPASTATSN